MSITHLAKFIDKTTIMLVSKSLLQLFHPDSPLPERLILNDYIKARRYQSIPDEQSYFQFLN